eukprot:7033701-Pyramimonas_sp.AAC.1
MHPAWKRRPMVMLGLGAASDYGRAGSELSREECLKAVALAFHMYREAKGFAQETVMSLGRAYGIRGAAERAMRCFHRHCA